MTPEPEEVKMTSAYDWKGVVYAVILPCPDLNQSAFYQGRNGYINRFTMLKQAVPVIVGPVIFILIGLYMMKSGVKRKVE